MLQIPVIGQFIQQQLFRGLDEGQRELAAAVLGDVGQIAVLVQNGADFSVPVNLIGFAFLAVGTDLHDVRIGEQNV